MAQTHDVVGAGTMGYGIIQVGATCSYQVALDIVPERLEQALTSIHKSVEKPCSKECISGGQREATLANVATASEVAAAANADFVVEAVVENLVVKKQVFAELNEHTRPEVILATTASSISITELGAVTGWPDRIIGMHFMNPVPRIKLVGVIRGLETSDETSATVVALEKLDKTPVEAQEYPGFISNRILCPMINEAIYTLMEGVGTRKEVDAVMKLGMNHPMGPLELADLIGLDIVLDIMEYCTLAWATSTAPLAKSKDVDYFQVPDEQWKTVE